MNDERGEEPSGGDGRMEEALRSFREAALADTERPQQFWDRQRLSIHERAAGGRTRPYRRILVWTSAAAAMALLWVIFTDDRAQPAPDFVAGHDQELLTMVHNSVHRDGPKALDPALVLVKELERAARAKADK
jgi:hypothetical protein